LNTENGRSGKMGLQHRRARIGNVTSKNQPSRRKSRTRCLCAAEILERRTLLAAVAWDGGGDGTNWNDPINWSNNAVPGSADDVTIDVAGSVTVLLRGSQPTVQSLVNRETLWLRGDNNFGS